MQGSRKDATTEVAPQADNRRLVLELAGAAAGVVVFVSLVGAAVISARLDSLGLPIDSTLAVLPRETVVIAGVRALSGGLLAALLVLSLLWVLDRLGVRVGRDGGSRWPTLLEAGVLVLAVVPLLAFTLVYGVTAWMVILSVFAAGAAAAVVLLILRLSSSFGQLSVRLLVVVAASRVAFSPSRASTTNRLRSTSPLSSSRTVDARTAFCSVSRPRRSCLLPTFSGGRSASTVAIPRDQVVNLQLSRVTRKVRPLGPNPMLRFRGDPARLKERVRRTEHVLAEAPQHPAVGPMEVSAPDLYGVGEGMAEVRSTDSVGTERSRRSERPQNATLEDLNEFTPLFAGETVVTTGSVLEATPWEEDKPQTVVLRDPTGRALSRDV